MDNKMGTKILNSKYQNEAKLNVIANKITEKLEELLEFFNIDLKRDRIKFYGMCPIHSGDKYNALNIYHNEDTPISIWKCRTHHCELVFGKDIIGFIRGVLSRNKCNWSKRDDTIISFSKTIEFILNFINEDYDKLKINSVEIEKKRFTNYMNNIIQQGKTISPHGMITRDNIRKLLKIPADYYLRRGYSQTILNNYDVGLCTNKQKEMYNRVVVPIYDDSYKYMIGCTGRSIYEKCNECKTWHNPNNSCPKEENKFRFSKWKHSNGFVGRNCLYNFWKAKKHISDTHVGILVEGLGECWKLEEAGIHNGVGLFGTSLSDGQRATLDSSGAMSLILLMDNDEAGQEAAAQIQKQCERIYNIYNIIINKKDVGAMTVDEIKQEIIPHIKKIEKVF